jgi:hypothetical protein
MNELDLISEELKKPKSRRRKKVTKLITPSLISDIESEIIKIELYLTKKIVSNRDGSYKPNDADEDQPLRIRVKYLRDLVNKLK